MKGNTMKKCLILFLCLFTTDSHSSGIASNTASAPCTNNTLETYSGNSNLSADWQPNEIKLRWYNNNTLMDVQSSANTCVYDGTLAVPQTAPTRTGYTFAGWTVRPEIDFAATIPTNENGYESWALYVTDDVNYCLYDTNTGNGYLVACDSDSTYNELQSYEWKVRFNHGDLYGMSICSSAEGTQWQPGTPTASTGRHCWCKATGYKSTNATNISGSAHTLPWVYRYGYGVESNCFVYCAIDCARGTELYPTFRTTLLSPANN